MTKDRFKEHFQSDDGAFVVIPKEGQPYRPDGEPLNAVDQAVIAGQDPIGEDSEESPDGRIHSQTQ